MHVYQPSRTSALKPLCVTDFAIGYLRASMCLSRVVYESEHVAVCLRVDGSIMICHQMQQVYSDVLPSFIEVHSSEGNWIYFPDS